MVSCFNSPSGPVKDKPRSRADPRKQLVLVLDQAGWHTSYDLVVPEHVYLLFLPPHSPELQPCEHLWQFTDAPLINRHLRDVD